MSHSLSAQNLSGDWKGSIDANGTEIPLIFHFLKTISGRFEGKWDSPKQNANGLSFSEVDVVGDSIHLGIKMIGGAFRGRFINNDSISGIWKQGQHETSLNLSRFDSKISVPMYPDEKEIAISSAGKVKLFGTLLSKNNHQKIAIIIAGSGPTDRDGNNPIIAPTNEYQMLARSLDSQNIASFRYDKRGVAKSIVENFKERDLVFEDYIKDAAKIYDFIHDTLGFKNVYFIGHSEGSLIAMIASQKKKVDGYISVAGAGRPIDVILEEQMHKSPLADSVKQQITTIFKQLKQGKEVDDFPKILSPLFRKSIQPYMISWLKYSPEKEIKKLNCPILIIQGDCDAQVQIIDAENLHNAHKKSLLSIIPMMSHTLKSAGENCGNQNKTYTDGSLPIDKILVDDIVKFIKKN